jgi:hypothetical protein
MNARVGSRQDIQKVDSYATLDSARSPDLANLTADEIATIFGRKSALVALHWLLASNELQQAALAALLSQPGRRSVSVLGSNLPVPRYLRLVSRLCREAAEQTEQEADDDREFESHAAAAGQVPLQQATSACAISAPWAIIHKVEADSNGRDKFTNQTCIVKDPGRINECVMFIPSGVSRDENNVHIFFGPGNASDPPNAFSNHTTCHALRASVAGTNWILISVAGIRQNGIDLANKVSASEILDILAAHGRPRRVDRLRLSSHSRGNKGLTESLKSRMLVAPSASSSVFPPSAVERIVAFDADEWGTADAANTAGISTRNLFGFKVRAQNWSMKQVIDLKNFPHGETCLNAVVWSRLIEDAKVVRPSIIIPANLDKMVTDLRLPALGLLTSRKNPSAPFVNFKDFCKTRWESVIKHESFKTQELGDFVKAQDLGRVAPYNDQHHFFVAEFVHEVTDAPPPQP